MIFLITGANGSGKSYYAVSLIKQIVETNKSKDVLPYEQWIQQYEQDENGELEPIIDNPKPLLRPIFTNIKGLSFDSEHIFTLSKGFDWRELPFGAVYFVDECHQHYPATGKPGPSGEPIIDEMDEHRHRGVDFYMMTQFPNKLHHVIRNLVSQHYHLQNMAGSQAASLFTWQYPCTNPNDYGERQGADKSVITYSKSVYQHYKSSSLHTRKLKVPKKLWFLALIFAFFGGRLALGIADHFTDDEISLATEKTSTSIPQLPSSNVESTSGEERLAPASASPVYSGCISSQTACICYDQDYIPLNMPFEQCKAISSRPLRTIPIISKKS